MSLGRLFKAAQGVFNAKTEELADANLIPEMEQRIRDAESSQREVDDKTADIMGKAKVVEGQISSQQEIIDKYLPKLKQLHTEDKTHELIPVITDKLNEAKAAMEQKQPLLDSYLQAAEKLKSQKRQNEDSIKKMKMELEQLKSNDTLIQAKKANAELVGDLSGKVNSAGDAASRLKAKQAAEMAKLDAKAELSGANNKSLDDQLNDIGLGDSSAKSASDWLDG